MTSYKGGLGRNLTDELQCLEPRLAVVLNTIASAVAEISELLRTGSVSKAGTSNVHGDQQLEVDVAADQLIFAKLRECGAVETASSEEQSEMLDMGGHGFSVAFDPIDGSSIIPANFSVGSIFGVWPGNQLLGTTGADQVAACYAVYGPRTVLVLARPQLETVPGLVVQEFVLIQQPDPETREAAVWRLEKDSIRIEEKKVFAPANLRAAAENAAYAKLFQEWLQKSYTLRYTGGFVPDVHHILCKGGGVFCNPKSKSAPAKLRLLYEAAPMGFILEAAGGSSSDGKGSILEQQIKAVEDRTVISLGSPEETRQTMPALAAA